MTINKFQGKTEEEAKEKARQKWQSGRCDHECARSKAKAFRSIKQTTYEVTATKKRPSREHRWQPFILRLKCMSRSI